MRKIRLSRFDSTYSVKWNGFTLRPNYWYGYTETELPIVSDSFIKFGKVRVWIGNNNKWEENWILIDSIRFPLDFSQHLWAKQYTMREKYYGRG